MRTPILLAAGFLLASTTAFAQPEAPASEDGPSLLDAIADGPSLRFSSVTAYWDNDGTYPNIIDDTDRFYTSGQGVEFGFRYDPGEDLASRLAPGWENPRFGVGLAIKQHIYTNSDISLVNPAPGDHPYGGWLYAALVFQRSSETVHDHFELDLGIVGPSSHADSIQKWIHEVVPDEIDPQGWDTQLEDEPTVNFAFERTWRTEKGELGGIEFDMLPSVRADLGNVFLRARGGLTFRIGTNLPDEFGPSSFLGKKDHTARAFGRHEHDWSVYAYIRGEVDAVGRNIFLDGNNFTTSRSVDAEVFVSRISIGVLARYKFIRFGWAQTFETKTFETQPDGQSYGSLVLSAQWEF